MTLDADILELVTIYRDDSPHDDNVIAAFVTEDMEPPHSLALDAKQSKIVQAFYAKHDPNGARAQFAKQEEELAGSEA